MNRTASLVSPLILAAALALVPGLAHAQRPIVIKFSHVVAEQTPKGQGALKFKEAAERLLPGRVEVQVFPNSTLYGDGKEVQALLLGDVHILAPALSKFDRYTKRLQIFDLPFLFDGPAAIACFGDSPKGRELLDSMQGRGLQGLAYWRNGMKVLSTNRPRLQVPADVRGLKFRIQSSDVLAMQFRTVGANPQKLAFGEVYQALQTGVVDGQENTWSNMYSQKLHEVQKTIAETQHGSLDYLLITSTRWWNGLPDEVREGLRVAIAEATEHANALAGEINASARQAIIDSGKVTVTGLSESERALWRKAMQPVVEKYTPEVGADAIAAALKCNGVPG